MRAYKFICKNGHIITRFKYSTECCGFCGTDVEELPWEYTPGQCEHLDLIMPAITHEEFMAIMKEYLSGGKMRVICSKCGQILVIEGQEIKEENPEYIG